MAVNWFKEMGRFLTGDMLREIHERVDRVHDIGEMEGSDYEAFGASRESLKQIMPAMCFMYRCYFRTEVHGLDPVAAMPRALIVGNHMTPVPVDGLNIATAFFLEPDPPRFMRTVTHYMLADMPFVSTMVYRTGQAIGAPDNVHRLFQDDNLILLFPEGAGAFRLYKNRYRLNHFNIGFMEMAIRYGYPIIPTAVIGSEESTMILAEVKQLNNKFGFINFPITLTFPWLGPLGFFPMPAKFRIWFGEPMDFTMHRDKLEDPDAITGFVEQVKRRIQSMLDERLAELPAVPFF